jgi:hypothetical protein
MAQALLANAKPDAVAASAIISADGSALMPHTVQWRAS